MLHKRLAKRIVTVTLVVALALSFVITFTGCRGLSDLERRARTLTNYTIVAEFCPDAKTITATQRVDYINNYNIELHNLYFHLFGNAYRQGARFSPVGVTEVARAFPNGESFGSLTINSVSVGGNSIGVNIGGQDEDILIVEFGQGLMPGRRIVVEMEWTLQLANVRHRLGWVENTVNLGNWFPIASVWEDGAWHANPYYNMGDPFHTELVNFDVSITVPHGWVVASSGCCESADLNGDRVTHRKEALVVRDFAIVMSPDFRVMTETVDGIEIRYYYIIDPTPELSLKAAVDSVRTFNEHIGMFPYPTLAVVETHFLHGGMEYPRLVMISNELSGDLYREVIVHEVAHQWWYAVVGNNPVLHAWMDEGLTEYTTTLFYVWNPQYGITYQERMADKLTGLLLYLELYGRQRPDTSMNRPLNEFRNSYDYMYMVYVKGGLMFSSLRRMIGDDNFFAALRLYYEQNFFQMARPENLIAAFEQASGKPLEAYFDSWLSGRVQMFAE